MSRSRTRIFPSALTLPFVAVVASHAGCQLNPMFWSEGNKIEVRPDKSFVVSLSSDLITSMGGPGSEKTQEFILRKLQNEGCAPTTPPADGAFAWGGYWYVKGMCK